MTTDTDTLVWYGGQCKALDDAGKVGGHLVLFGSPDQTDASALKDYFTPETDFALEDVGGRSRLLYHHGLDPRLGNKRLGVAAGTIKADDLGLWLEGQLDLRDRYEQKIWAMVKANKMGLSSGTASHLIRRERQPNGANKILAWPLGLDASLTPAPAEPRTSAVALKSLLEGAVKGDCLGEMSEPAAAMAAVRALQDLLGCALWKSLGDEGLAPADRLARMGGAFDEFKDTCLKMIRPLLIAADGGATKAEDDRLLDRIGETLARCHGLDL